MALNAELYTETKDVLLTLHFHVDPFAIDEREYCISSSLCKADGIPSLQIVHNGPRTA